MNAKKEILKLANGEKILAISLGPKGNDECARQIFFKGPEQVQDALDILDFEFDAGFGGENGFAVLVWSETKVIFKQTYDGSESYVAIPRNPDKEIMPRGFGG